MNQKPNMKRAVAIHAAIALNAMAAMAHVRKEPSSSSGRVNDTTSITHSAQVVPCALSNVLAVSYTHLDVYKRQPVSLQVYTNDYDLST